MVEVSLQAESRHVVTGLGDMGIVNCRGLSLGPSSWES